MSPFFSIIVVCLNPGEKLITTLRSIEEQTFHDFEVIVKDGLSTDGSLDYVQELVAQWKHKDLDLRLISKKDSGIYDAMNQAVTEASGRYIYFLNSGDCFASKEVLQEIANGIVTDRGEAEVAKTVYYGNIFERKTQQKVTSNPHLDAFGCYRNVPCHQACFYSRELLVAHPFQTTYKVRADYEHFLWCFFKEKATMIYRDLTIADYEGGGYSETKANQKVSAAEHQEITKQYFTQAQLSKYKFILCITLAPLRTWIAANKKLAGVYNRIKNLVYRK